MIPNLIKIVVGALVAMLVLFSCCERIDAGHVGIKINMSGDDKGVSNTELVTGYQFYIPGASRIEEWPAYAVTYDLGEFPVQTKGGTSFTAHPSLTVAIDPSRAGELYTRFRVPVDQIVGGFGINAVKESFRHVGNEFTPDSLINNRGAFEAALTNDVIKRLGKEGFIVSQVASGLTPPADMVRRINAKNTSIQVAQQRENDLRIKRADIQIEKAEADKDAYVVKTAADAEAYANQKKQQTLTPLLVEMKRIEKWNGSYPGVMGGGAGMMLNIK